MSQLTVRPGPPLRGLVAVPGDKSISHRALLLSAVADGTSHVRGFLPGGDCRATLGVLRVLGVDVDTLSPTDLRVHGRGLGGLQEPDDVLDCVRSGTTLRLLAGLLAGHSMTAVLSGDAQLRRRPMGRVVEPLRLMGATILGPGGGRRAPLTVQGGSLRGIDYTLPVASAQVKSPLLLAGLQADGPTCLSVPGPARDHTERMLLAMGAPLRVEPGQAAKVDHVVRLSPAAALEPLDLLIPGDFSSAAFLLVAAALVPGSQVTVRGVGVNPTRTGLLDILRAMGAGVTVEDERQANGEPVADLLVRSAGLRAVQVGGDLVVRTIDEFPVLAVAASQAQGETLVRDAAELRVKETDRVATTVQELRRLGAEIEPRPDGFVVRGPAHLCGARVHSHGDHRLGMALAVAGLVATGETVIEDAGCISDSFPGFEAALVHLGGQVA